MSSLIQSTGMTLSSSVRDPDVMPTETRKTSSGIFRMELAPEKTNAALWALLYAENGRERTHSTDARADLHMTTEASSSPPNQMHSNAWTSIFHPNHQHLQDFTPRDDGAIFQPTHQRVQNATASTSHENQQPLQDLTPRDVGAVFQSTHQSAQHRSDKRYST